MRIFKHGGTVFELDSHGFMLNPKKWNRPLSEGLAPELGITGGLTKEHWDVIHFIRSAVEKTGRCPNIFETCRANSLRRQELKRLFPTGYMRGACKLAGVSYKEAYLKSDYIEDVAESLRSVVMRKEYRVDVRGFLVYPDEWDEHFAAHRAHDMKIPGGKLTPAHWRVIQYLRQSFQNTGKVSTIIETCEAIDLEIDELEKLFPDGYHRGAVKVAGLRLR
jgi:TusE/DsrC/DsvC family sulfur relay protein